MKILITGAGGYIGSVATYTFLQKGYEVVGSDNFSFGHEQTPHQKTDFFLNVCCLWGSSICAGGRKTSDGSG